MPIVYYIPPPPIVYYVEPSPPVVVVSKPIQPAPVVERYTETVVIPQVTRYPVRSYVIPRTVTPRWTITPQRH